MSRYGTAKLILGNPEARRVVASGARISTGEGSAFDIYAKSGNDEKDLRLIGKVLASGHKSVLEHQTFSIAFNDVSVLVEQFVIEFRLASFTVKSRRYVDFTDAGFVIPAGLTSAEEARYVDRTRALFDCYAQLLDLGIPREDARFVLPYGFCSNFFVTINARELVHMLCAMLRGRGSAFDELRTLGEQLREQFDALYPGLLDAELLSVPTEAMRTEEIVINNGGIVEASVRLVSLPVEPMETLTDALRFTKRFDIATDAEIPDADCLRALLNDARPRELELLNYAFRIDNVSLACVTHFTRHRMLSLMLEPTLTALAGGRYILPRSIDSLPEARSLYLKAFEEQSQAASEAHANGTEAVLLSYYAMAGHTTGMLISMNARELAHFFRLRCCERAQWEIRGIAREMLTQLCETESAPLFGCCGPTCAVSGRCPEGRMSCGHPVTIRDGVWTRR